MIIDQGPSATGPWREAWRQRYAVGTGGPAAWPAAEKSARLIITTDAYVRLRWDGACNFDPNADPEFVIGLAGEALP